MRVAVAVIGAIGPAILFVVVSSAAVNGQATANGEMVGRIADSAGGVIPGARVSISSGDERRETMTDADGRFTLRSLRLGTYTVTVDLPGFRSRTGTITLSPTARRAHIGWHLEVGCIAQASYVVPSPRRAAAVADSIVHVRVTSDDGPVLWSSRPDCPGDVVPSYTVEVLNEVARRSSSVERGATLQIYPLPFTRLQPGAEYVALLGTGLILPVVSGRISSSLGEPLTGMTVEEALEALAQWSREAPPER